MRRRRVSFRCTFMKCKCWMLGGRREQKIRSVDCAGSSFSRGVVILVCEFEVSVLWFGELVPSCAHPVYKRRLLP